MKRTDIDVADTLLAVPQDAAIIIKVPDIDEDLEMVLERNDLWNELTEFPSLARLHIQLIQIDSIITSYPQVKELYHKQELTLSLHKSGRDHYEYIIYFPLISSANERQIIQLLEEQFNGILTQRKYSNTRIWDVKSGTDKSRNLSFTFSRGLFMISHSGILLEEAIRQLDLKNNIASSSNFIKVAGTAGRNVEANIYVNYKSFPVMFSMIFKDQFRKDVERFTDFARWTEIDLSVRNDALLLNGFTSTDESSNEYLNIFLDQSPQKIEIEKAIPDQVAALIIYGFEDYGKFKDKYNQFLEFRGEGNEYLNNIQAINQQYDIDIEGLFSSFIESEAGVVITDIKNYDWDQNTFLVFRTISRSVAEDNLVEVFEKIAIKKGTGIQSMIQEHMIDEGLQIRVYQVPVPGLANIILGKGYEGLNSNYCAFYDNYLVFGNSVQALSKYIHSNILQANLKSDLEFNKFSNYLSSRSNLYIYFDITRSFDLIHKYLREDFVKNLEENNDHLKKFHAFAYQLTTEGNLLYNNMFIKYIPDAIKEPQTVWESRLDHPLQCKPKLVTNHYTNEKEIFVQDKMNNIYLINSSGRILWKQQLEKEILSDVYQIDFYKNGKLQLLFNTKDNIHLFDRNGNYVEKYPVKLRSPATNGLALFDYEKNRDYRIFIATQDKRIYAYNKEGNLIKGWQFEKSEHTVHHPLQHFRIGEKDYIVFSDLYTIYILNRRGVTRVSVKDHFPISRNNYFTLESTTTGIKSRMAITDSTGHVHFVYFDGTTEEFILDEFTSDHYFVYADLDGNNTKEFIFIDGNEIKGFSNNKKLIFSNHYKCNISHAPVIYRFTNTDKKIGIVTDEKMEIYLLNNDGTIYKGFPLRGSTQFSIGNLSRSTSKFNLVVGSDHNFLYNYSVQ